MALTVCVARLDIMSNPELWVVKGLEVVAEVPVRRGKNFRRGAVLELPQLAARRGRVVGADGGAARLR